MEAGVGGHGELALEKKTALMNIEWEQFASTVILTLRSATDLGFTRDRHLSAQVGYSRLGVARLEG
jgi:hypothetical protein